MRHDERIVSAITAPRTRWNVIRFDELPIGDIGRLQSKKIADRRRDIQTSAEVRIRFGSLIAGDVLHVIGPKRTAGLPLCVTSSAAFANGHPVVFANRLSGPGIRLPEPWNN